MKLFFHFAFIIITIFILIKTIFYGVYEINTEKNKTGGIAVILFSIFTTILANIIMFFR